MQPSRENMIRSSPASIRSASRSAMGSSSPKWSPASHIHMCFISAPRCRRPNTSTCSTKLVAVTRMALLAGLAKPTSLPPSPASAVHCARKGSDRPPRRSHETSTETSRLRREARSGGLLRTGAHKDEAPGGRGLVQGLWGKPSWWGSSLASERSHHHLAHRMLRRREARSGLREARRGCAKQDEVARR